LIGNHMICACLTPSPSPSRRWSRLAIG
jgi:hypothetical protein